jgi:small-conductance mechanosensitive channel
VRITLVSALVLLVGSPCVLAQKPSAKPSGTEATLRFANRPIATFRANLASRSPAARAQSAQTLLGALVDSGIVGPAATQRFQDAVVVTLGGQNVFFLAKEDADDLAGETLDSIGARAVERLRVAVAEEVDLKRPSVLVRGALLALLATAVAAMVFWLLVAGYRRATSRVAAAIERQLDRHRLGTPDQSRLGPVLNAAKWAVRAMAVLLGALTADVWLTFILTRFPYTRPWGEGLRGFLLSRCEVLGLRVLHALPGIFTVAVIVLATRFAVYCLGIVFDAVERRQMSLPFVDADLARPTQRIVAALAWICCIVMAYPYIPGSSSDAFKGVSVFAGLIISLGSTGLVNQMMSGFVITYSRSVRIGEFVKIGDVQGTVTRIGMLTTIVRMPSGEEHVLPNAVVASQVIAHYSRPGTRRGVWVGTSVTIGYDTPWRQVHALLLEAARKTTGLVNDPPPEVRQTALQDFYVEYTLLVSPEEPEHRGAMLAELHARIQDLFNEHGVQIMSPHYLADPPEPKVVAKAQWFTAPAKPD